MLHSVSDSRVVRSPEKHRKADFVRKGKLLKKTIVVFWSYEEIEKVWAQDQANGKN